MLKTLLCAFLVAAMLSTAVHADTKAAVGQKAPEFSLKDTDGNTVNLADFKGRVVVLEWFNEECPYVKKHYSGGNMNKVAQQYGDKGIVWLTINSTNGKSAEDMKNVAREWSINRPILMDSDGTVGKAYGAKTTPHMYIIDKGGNLAYVGAIDSNSSDDPKTIQGATNYVAKSLDEVLSDKPVSEPQTKPYGCSVKYKK